MRQTATWTGLIPARAMTLPRTASHDSGGRERPSPGAPAAKDQSVQQSVQILLRESARTRDPRVRDRIVTLHDRMVRYLAGRFGLGAGTTSDDLIQVGYIGLLAAIERYDPEKGVSFATF